jgi:hypothetical protein
MQMRVSKLTVHRLGHKPTEFVDCVVIYEERIIRIRYNNDTEECHLPYKDWVGCDVVVTSSEEE